MFRDMPIDVPLRMNLHLGTDSKQGSVLQSKADFGCPNISSIISTVWIESMAGSVEAGRWFRRG